MQATRGKRRLRKYEVLDFIVEYADANSGATPSQRVIAAALGLSVQRINYLMSRLSDERWVKYITRETYIVCESVWEASPVLP